MSSTSAVIDLNPILDEISDIQKRLEDLKGKMKKEIRNKHAKVKFGRYTIKLSSPGKSPNNKSRKSKS